MDNDCGRMTDGFGRMTDKVATANYIGQRRRSYGGMMQPSTDTGEDNKE